ncbi:putative lipoprotein [Vibrio ichthyoenteri ATCC 700023]|uniref:Putative lipoprotein n=1 Tax=Vibrio ichthyoenteri ATCC 700023 TaxID=870968 RepID=F9S523_9VIBR|nr:hypothetical protein [Vibrio ichthyoenteri]EGU36197.1 putative lipoprotein [Vibrio ichthyoenteri ATCC 700023]
MKALKTPVAIASLLALQACSVFDTSPALTSAQTNQVKASLDQPNSIKPQTFIMRGEVILGHEVSSIQPCGSEQQYWLSLDNDKFQQGIKLLNAPYQPMYGEMIGHLETSGNEGFDADYTARFVVEKVNMLTAENPQRCERPTQNTRAFGNEPFWSLDFTTTHLSFQPMGGEKQTLAITTSRIEPNRRRYDFAQGQLELNHRSCSDGMSDSLYGWSANLQINDKRYNGCATLSNADATQDWVGVYQAASTQNSTFSIKLDVHPDHTATTTYQYQDGSSDSVERGYWQQLNPDQVQVVMTHHQQQPLLSERLFTRDAEQLSAKKEKVGDIIYPIADGGLVLFKSQAENSVSAAASTQSNPRAIASTAEFNPKVDRAIRDYFKTENIVPDNTRYRWLTYDLNGDSQPELLVQLDWCGSGGCTLLIFAHNEQQWQFNSRMTLVNTPLNLGQKSQHGWRDLVLFVSGGGAQANQHVLHFNGKHYPLNPSIAPVAGLSDISQVQLFSDGLTPHQQGVQM